MTICHFKKNMAKLFKKNNQFVLDELNLKQIDLFALENNEILEIKVTVVDKRTISEQQRKFIFAIFKQISEYTGYDVEFLRNELELQFASVNNFEIQSLSNCSVSYANDMIRCLIDYCIFNDIPVDKQILDSNKYFFDEKQSYVLALKRKCVVCGGYADIHHVDSVGIGQNRKKISHIGKKCLPLCRKHHIETHNLGDTTFIEKYHLTPFVIDEKFNKFIKKGYLNIFKEDMHDK